MHVLNKRKFLDLSILCIAFFWLQAAATHKSLRFKWSGMPEGIRVHRRSLFQDKQLSPDDKRLASAKLDSLPPKRVKNITTTVADGKAAPGQYYVLISIKSAGKTTASEKTLKIQ